jgi:diaminopimelate decarboxylase
VIILYLKKEPFTNKEMTSEISEGDILAFRNAGGYCQTLVGNYNSRLRPTEVFWYNGDAHLIRKRETFEDLVRNQVVVEFEDVLI